MGSWGCIFSLVTSLFVGFIQFYFIFHAFRSADDADLVGETDTLQDLRVSFIPGKGFLSIDSEEILVRFHMFQPKAFKISQL